MLSAFKKIFAVLNRDIKSFFPSGNSTNVSVREPLTQSQVLPQPVLHPTPEPLPLILNASDLIRIQRRRIVLDWRDKSLLSALTSGKDVFSSFSGYIDTQLNEVTMLDRVFPGKAREVLTVEFNRRVLEKLHGESQRSVDNFFVQMASWECLNNSKPQLAYPFKFSHLPFLDDVGFKPSNRGKILTLLGEHISGYQGLIRALQNDISDFANDLTRKILL